MELRDIKFYKDPLDIRMLKARLEADEKFKQIWRRRRKEIINHEIEQTIHRRLTGIIENFVTILIRGFQGSFKSSLGLEFGKRTDPEFTAEQVAFLYQEFKELLNQSKAGQSFQLDEEVFIHGVGSQRIVEEIQSIIETLRKRKNSMIIVSPQDKYFPEEIFTFVLETIDFCMLGTCKENKELHEVRDCEQGIEETEHEVKKAYVRLVVKKSNIYMGFYIQEINWNDDLWKEYSKKKDVWLEIAKTQEFQKLDYEEEAKKILARPETNEYKSKKDLRLLLEKLKPNLTIGEKELLINEIAIQRKRKEIET